MWTWGVLTARRLALEGMFSAKADGPWRHLCALQALGVALSPLGLACGGSAQGGAVYGSEEGWG